MKFKFLSRLKSKIKSTFSIPDLILNEKGRIEILSRYAIVYLFAIVFALIIVAKMIVMVVETPKFLLPRSIKDDFENAILLNCDYSDLRVIFKNKKRVNIKSYPNWNKYLYNKNVDLAYILDEMTAEYYNRQLEDSIYILKLKRFKIEHNEKNPFDKLEESQKELFLALRKNSGESYHLISKNVLSISEELSNKNLTIEKYLDKSNQSYRLAIIALLITLAQTIPVIWKSLKLYLIRRNNEETGTNT